MMLTTVHDVQCVCRPRFAGGWCHFPCVLQHALGLGFSTFLPGLARIVFMYCFTSFFFFFGGGNDCWCCLIYCFYYFMISSVGGSSCMGLVAL